MLKKVYVVLGLCALLTLPGYAQRPFKMAKYVTEAMTGGVASAFSKNVPVTVLNAEMVGNAVLRAQIAAASHRYVTSAQLFKRVQENNGFEGIKLADIHALQEKFEHLDEVVKLQSAAFTGYQGALWSAKPQGAEEVLLNPQVQGLVNVLDLQHYMQVHDNQFPQLFTVAPGGWLLATDVWTSHEGNAAVRQVLNILIKEQFGKTSPAIIEQLVLLYAGAANPVPVDTLVRQLEDWRAAHNVKAPQAPQLPQSLSTVGSLRSSNAENLWLAMQIRLLQLTPDIELPEILKEAKVTH